MVVPTFVRQALEGRPISVFGTGKQSRCFCYVGDTVAGVLKLLDTPAAIGQVFNIGSSQEITIEGLANLIKTKLNSSSLISYTPYDQAYEEGFEDMPRRVPSTAKIERMVGWHTSVSLDTTIDLIAEYFQQKQKPLAYFPTAIMRNGALPEPELPRPAI
jgi:UDP-glucose 4-epimerase